MIEGLRNFLILLKIMEIWMESIKKNVFTQHLCHTLDVTQGQFLGSQLVGIRVFLSPRFVT